MFVTVLRKVLWFTLLGWVAILLAGPVIGVVGTILPFALVGALVWLVWWGGNYVVERFRPSAVREQLKADRIVPALGQGARIVGREAGRVFQAGLHHCREAAPALKEHACAFGCGAGRMVREGMQQCREVVPAMRSRGSRFSEKMSAFLRATSRLFLEISCGAIVGGLLAWFAVDNTEQTVAIGALLGAALGFVVGGPKRQPERELAISDQ
jgi:hypothetical protein